MMDDQKQAKSMNFIKIGRSKSDSSNISDNSSSLKLQSPREINECAMHMSGSTEKFNRQQREPPSPHVSSDEVRIKVSVEDIAQRIASQLDGQNENSSTFLCLEGITTDGDSDSSRRRIFSKKKSNWKARLSKIVQQALKMCGLAAVASIAVPLIAGGGVLTIVVAGVAGIVSVPVLYGLNKYRRDVRLDRDPYPYSFVVEEIFKLCQSLATKLAAARFLRKDCGLECNIGRKLPDEEEARDLDADDSSSNDTYTQSFSEYENGCRDDLLGHFSAENVSETDNYVQTVVLKDEINTTIAKDIGNQKKLDVFTSNANETPPYTCSGRKELDSPTSNVVKVTVNPLTFDETSVKHNTPVELSSEKEPHEERQADNVRECEDQGDSGTEQQTRGHADEPNFSLSLSNQVAGHFELSQDKSFNHEIPALSEMELLIVDSSTEDEDCSEVDEKESGSETASKIADRRQALSDEEDLYGRRDVQSTLPRKSISDTFCCVREPNVANDKFVRFSRHNHYEVDTNQNWGLLEPGGNNEAKTNIRIQIQKDEKGETDDQLHDGEEKPSDKETKRGRRRRKRRNNKRVTTANHQGLTAGEVSDELGKNKQEQLNSNVSKKPTIVQNTSQNAGELQGKTTTPKKGKQAAKAVATYNENESKIAEGSTEKKPRKKKDRTKKDPAVKHELQPNTPKLNISGLSTTKNADVSNSPNQEEKPQAGDNNSGGGTPVTKIMVNKQDKGEDDEDKDVVALYDCID